MEQPAKHVELCPATPDQEPILANLLELYAHDFSEFIDVELGPDGRFGWRRLAKLDRLARNGHFISGLMESGVEFVAVDMPSANRFVVHILAAVAEQEAEAISKRTKAALAAAKARGTKLGGLRVSSERFAEIAAEGRKVAASVLTARKEAHQKGVLPVIEEIRAQGIITLRGIAAELNARGELPPRGGQWSAVQVLRALDGLANNQKTTVAA